MNIEIVKQSKDEVEVMADNLTTVEILRVYLNSAGVDFAAWRREHPTKPILFRISTSGESVKKAVSDAVSVIKKDLDKIGKSVKK